MSQINQDKIVECTSMMLSLPFFRDEKSFLKGLLRGNIVTELPMGPKLYLYCSDGSKIAQNIENQNLKNMQ